MTTTCLCTACGHIWQGPAETPCPSCGFTGVVCLPATHPAALALRSRAAYTDAEPHSDSRCWTRPELDHGHCPSSTECTALEHFTPCDACGKRPAGHGHFALYCAPCSELPYWEVAP